MNRITILSLFCLCANLATAQRTMQRLPDTGQTGSYTTTFGEDSDYLINAPSYVVNGNGTVTDTVTGLIWMSADGGEMTFENARLYADTLTYAGFNDWRLPLAGELFSIQQLQHSNPALDPVAFVSTGAEYWWSSETQVNDSNKVWVTNAGGGIGNHRRSETISAGGTKRFHVRAVRQPLPAVTVNPRFINHGDGTVTDGMTDLVWQSVPYGDSLTWEQALNYVDTLSLAGENDWRLPNIKELQSLTDLNHYNPSFDTINFSFPSQGKYWSSTTLQNQPLQAWYLDSRFGITTYLPKTSRNLLVAVRGNLPISTGLPVSTSSSLGLPVFPNPFRGSLRLRADLEGSEVCLTDLAGKIVYCGKDVSNTDFSDLPAGSYLMYFPGSSYRTVVLSKY